LDNDGNYDVSGDGNITGRWQLGHHRAHFWVADDCGNISEIDLEIDVIDCKAPTPICINGLSTDLMMNGEVEIWATDFDAGSFDYCHDFEFFVNIVKDADNNGVLSPDEYLSSPPNTKSIVLTCEERPDAVIQVWVVELSGDGVNDFDHCQTFVDVLDNLGACASSRTISGKIETEEEEFVQNVEVQLNDQTAQSVFTGNGGLFEFSNLAVGHDYTVTPMLDDDPRNGVSTFDLVLISKHILNVEKLDSPYKIIAADANKSGNVSAFDLVALRKLILRLSDEFPNNTSWRFVDKNYMFPDPTKPWTEEFPEVISYNNLAVDQLNTDFVAIKIGDVNANVRPNNLTNIDERTYGKFKLKVEDFALKAGEEISVDFKATQNVQGFQFTLNYNPKSVDLIDIIPGIAKAENLHLFKEGVLTTSWNANTEIKDATMFTLILHGKADAHLSEVLKLNSEFTKAEAYYENSELLDVALDFGNSIRETKFELYQNNPNPFKGETSIGFTLPEATSVTLTFSDVNGKVVKRLSGDFTKGYNEIQINNTDLGTTGVLWYELKTSTNKASRKMILIK